jgi:hypothetical protein
MKRVESDFHIFGLLLSVNNHGLPNKLTMSNVDSSENSAISHRPQYYLFRQHVIPNLNPRISSFNRFFETSNFLQYFI